MQEVLNITAAKLEEIIKPLNDNDFEHSKSSYAEVGSPDSTEEMKNLESRQAAVTLLQIKNYDPNKYVVKQEEEPRIMFNSGPSLPPSDRAREVMHCNAVIDIISKAVAVAQRENEEAAKYPGKYAGVIERRHASVGGERERYTDSDYGEDKYAYASQSAASPCTTDDRDRDREMDLSLYPPVKTEPEPEPDYYQRTMTQTNANFADEYKQHVFGRNNSMGNTSKDNSSVYEECSQSSSGSDPDRLQMDISQMSQVIQL